MATQANNQVVLSTEGKEALARRLTALTRGAIDITYMPNSWETDDDGREIEGTRDNLFSGMADGADEWWFVSLDASKGDMRGQLAAELYRMASMYHDLAEIVNPDTRPDKFAEACEHFLREKGAA